MIDLLHDFISALMRSLRWREIRVAGQRSATYIATVDADPEWMGLSESSG